MPRRQVIVEEEIDPAEMIPTLLAAILLVASCPKCQGTGARGTCDCRKVGYDIAADVLQSTGYFEPPPEQRR